MKLAKVISEIKQAGGSGPFFIYNEDEEELQYILYPEIFANWDHDDHTAYFWIGIAYGLDCSNPLTIADQMENNNKQLIQGIRLLFNDLVNNNIQINNLDEQEDDGDYFLTFEVSKEQLKPFIKNL